MASEQEDLRTVAIYMVSSKYDANTHIRRHDTQLTPVLSPCQDIAGKMRTNMVRAGDGSDQDGA